MEITVRGIDCCCAKKEMTYRFPNDLPSSEALTFAIAKANNETVSIKYGTEWKLVKKFAEIRSVENTSKYVTENGESENDE